MQQEFSNVHLRRPITRLWSNERMRTTDVSRMTSEPWQVICCRAVISENDEADSGTLVTSWTFEHSDLEPRPVYSIASSTSEITKETKSTSHHQPTLSIRAQYSKTWCEHYSGRATVALSRMTSEAHTLKSDLLSRGYFWEWWSWQRNTCHLVNFWTQRPRTASCLPKRLINNRDYKRNQINEPPPALPLYSGTIQQDTMWTLFRQATVVLSSASLNIISLIPLKVQ